MRQKALVVINICLIALIIFLLLRKDTSIVKGNLAYPIVGTYKGKSAQGMAIWQDCAYLFNDGGHCRVLNLKNGKIVNEFELASSNKNTHVNSACFVHTQDSKDEPLLYITEYNMPSRCFVEQLKGSKTELVQVIKVQNNGKDTFIQTWIADEKESFLYSVTRMSPPKGEKYTDKIKITKYKLPSLNEGREIVLSEKDCLDSYIVYFASGTQGGKIKGKYMYLASGLQAASHGNFNAKRVLQVIDLSRKKIVKTIDMTYLTTNEPEDLDFYGDNCLLYCGQEGGIYEIKIDIDERNDN